MSSLEVRNLTVRYRDLIAVHGVSFKVGDGATVALLGANGAGKTSVIRAINGTVGAISGLIELDANRINGMRPDQRIRLGVATVPENRDLFKTLTVNENLMVGAYT